MLSPDEAREKAGLTPTGEPWAEKHYITKNYEEAGSKSSEETIKTPGSVFNYSACCDTIYAKDQPRDSKGRFAGTGGSKRRYKAKLGKKEYSRLCSQIATDFPDLKPGDRKEFYCNRNHVYSFTVIEFGTYDFTLRKEIHEKNRGKKGGKKL